MYIAFMHVPFMFTCPYVRLIVHDDVIYIYNVIIFTLSFTFPSRLPLRISHHQGALPTCAQ